MNDALRLAHELDIVRWSGAQAEAATMLRKQDAAIKQLREALENCRVDYDYHGNPMEDCDRKVLEALAATEQLRVPRRAGMNTIQVDPRMNPDGTQMCEKP